MFQKTNFKILVIFLVTFITICSRNVIADTTSTAPIPISGTISDAGKIPPTPADDLPNQSVSIISSFPSASSTSSDMNPNPNSTASSSSTSTKSSNANRIGSGVVGISVVVGMFGWFVGVKSL